MFCWLPLGPGMDAMHHPPKQCCWPSNITPRWQWSPQQDNVPWEDCSGMTQGPWQRVRVSHLSSKYLRSQFDRAFVGHAWTSQIHDLALTRVARWGFHGTDFFRHIQYDAGLDWDLWNLEGRCTPRTLCHVALYSITMIFFWTFNFSCVTRTNLP